MTTAVEGGEGSESRPGRSLPPGKTRYPLYRRLGGPKGRSGQVRKISPPKGIRSPYRPARGLSLYRLSYPGPQFIRNNLQFQRVSGWIINAEVPANRFHELSNTRLRLGKANLPTVEPYERWNVRLVTLNVVTDILFILWNNQQMQLYQSILFHC